MYYVYILANNRPTLYTGVTNNLIRRIYEHRTELIEGFTKKYHIHNLVYYDLGEDITWAIIREKQIKNMRREEKLTLIKTGNPRFEDLYDLLLEQIPNKSE